MIGKSTRDALAEPAGTFTTLPDMRQTRRPTLNDVARAAGVSTATVSRVLNGKAWVSDETRQCVETAVRTTGYIANRQARSLATGRAGSVAFLLQSSFQNLFSDPTFAQLLNGVASELTRHHTTLVLLVAESSEERHNVEEYLRSGHVDGVMLVSSHDDDPMLERLIESGVPLASAGLPLGHEGRISSVSVNEVHSAVTACQHLKDMGRSRIAHLAGPSDTPGGRLRKEGYAQVVGEDAASLTVEGDWTIHSGRAGMQELLRRDPGIDAVFAASDSMALGAMLELRDAGRRVPEDVAVIGFDDSGLAEAASPPLTTMRQPWDELSRELAQLLIDAIAGEPVRHAVLPATLVERQST